MMGEIGGCGMGYLFENMEKWTFRLKDEIRKEKRRERMKQKKRICVYSRKQTISKDIDVNFNAWNWKGKEIHGNGKLFL